MEDLVMSSLVRLDTYDPKKGDLNVVVETPQGSRNKYKYDADNKVFKVAHLLPTGMAFPFDFGFIPSTLGDDGDPLDVLVLMEEPAPGGYLVPARVIGVLEAEQTEDGETERNDRLIAVCKESRQHRSVQSLSKLEERIVKEIEHFFVSYNEMRGREFKPLGWYGRRRAGKLIKEGRARYRQQQKQGKKKHANGSK